MKCIRFLDWEIRHSKLASEIIRLKGTGMFSLCLLKDQAYRTSVPNLTSTNEKVRTAIRIVSQDFLIDIWINLENSLPTVTGKSGADAEHQ